MGTIDIVLLILFIPGITRGFYRGVVLQLVSLLAVVVGCIVASRFANGLSELALHQFTEVDPKLMYVICFALLFLLSAIVMSVLGRLFTKLIHFASLGWLNRVLGAVFSIFISAFVLGLLISLFEGLNSSWQIADPETFKDLRVWPFLRDFACGILPTLKAFIHDYVVPASLTVY